MDIRRLRQILSRILFGSDKIAKRTTLFYSTDSYFQGTTVGQCWSLVNDENVLRAASRVDLQARIRPDSPTALVYLTTAN